MPLPGALGLAMLLLLEIVLPFATLPLDGGGDGDNDELVGGGGDNIGMGMSLELLRSHNIAGTPKLVKGGIPRCGRREKTSWMAGSADDVGRVVGVDTGHGIGMCPSPLKWSGVDGSPGPMVFSK